MSTMHKSLVGAAIYAMLCRAQSITTKCFHFTVRNGSTKKPHDFTQVPDLISFGVGIPN